MSPRKQEKCTESSILFCFLLSSTLLVLVHTYSNPISKGMAGEFVGGAALGTAFSALYDGVKELISKNHIFKSLLVNMKSSLETLKPLIQQIAQSNELLSRPEEELKGLEAVMEDGKDLISKCSKIRQWNIYKKYEYANKLVEWDQLLRRQLDVLKVQEARDVKENTVLLRTIEAVVKRIEENVVVRNYSSTVEPRDLERRVVEDPANKSFGSEEDDGEVCSGKTEVYGTALYNFTAGGEDELNLIAGDEIEIEYEVDDWFYVKKKRPGKDGKMAGLVPVLYVRYLS
ncbi:putative powdery mildew resistance protein, RPW8 [Rosa chinensis]|uniref:Putative powdery mildew resistance protein, RPW8 n=1 Tax=Rosa chinensis TaxID=74649 RepID=A0A2P6RY91_ROSCH|nr:putative powdery mildew resistance protein, RPW8 [Rosa chinensis]